MRAAAAAATPATAPAAAVRPARMAALLNKRIKGPGCDLSRLRLFSDGLHCGTFCINEIIRNKLERGQF